MAPERDAVINVTSYNKQICGSGHSAYAQIEAHEGAQQRQSVLLIGKTSFGNASTSHICRTLDESFSGYKIAPSMALKRIKIRLNII